VIELKPHIQNELKLHDIIIMEIYICKEKIEKKSLKGHHYKYSISINHYERRDNVDIVEVLIEEDMLDSDEDEKSPKVSLASMC
jgi:hypothetical protein